MHPNLSIISIRYIHSRSFSRFLGQRFDSEIILEKQRISRIFKDFAGIVSGTKIKPKSLENDLEWVYAKIPFWWRAIHFKRIFNGTLCFLGCLSLNGCEHLPNLLGLLQLNQQAARYANIPAATESAKNEPKGPKIRLKKVTLIADKNANGNSATIVDLIFVYEQKVLNTLMNMPARDYFRDKRLLQANYPSMFLTHSWEIPPGQSIINQDVHTKGNKPLGVILFADYTTPGVHRNRLGSEEKIRVILGSDQLQIFHESV